MYQLFSRSMKRHNARKGFSLVELVVVILIIAILAVAVFAGGSAVIKRSQVSRTTSDLHNFSVAIESALNETPSVANMSKESEFTAIINAVNSNLSTDYQLTRLEADVSGNITTAQSVVNATRTDDSVLTGTYAIYVSAKTDAWDNPYYVIFDATERHAAGISEFYITVVSAGPNAQTTITSVTTGTGIEADDVFLLVQYTDGDVAAVTYNCDGDTLKNGADTQLTLLKTTKGVKATAETGKTAQGQYIGLATTVNGTGENAGTKNVCPVNFKPAD
jgi:prepilin-type N-terminal cleavage/methylation domain-containing protein